MSATSHNVDQEFVKYALEARMLCRVVSRVATQHFTGKKKLHNPICTIISPRVVLIISELPSGSSRHWDYPGSLYYNKMTLQSKENEQLFIAKIKPKSCVLV